ncbi:hypothetical protein BKA65DRAFT_580891 [Rhexocercosporidium sp. MPI-PUGE-AT-0058]|nr:hypothetical protein BKA65DRAFT_580891 [Rhexocercosporidium sp. MPI-PUGE-AT-0058]
MKFTLTTWHNTLATFLLLFTSIVAVQLDITLDSAAAAKGRFVWSSRVTYSEDVGTLFSDAELYGMASEAYAEMAADWVVRKSTRKQRPAMMGAWAIGNNIYFSSSIKGGAFLYDLNLGPAESSQSIIALRRCTISMQVNSEHRTGASCAEVMGIHQFYNDPEVTLNKADPTTWPKSRIVAFGIAGKSKDPGPVPPCGDANAWGCSTYTASLGITSVDTGVGVAKKDPAVAPQNTVQIPVC